MNTPHIPIPILTHDGSLIIVSAGNHKAVAARLPDGYIADAATQCLKVTDDLSAQKTANGELGNMTRQQVQKMKTLHHYMARAQKTAKIAFPGQTVKLHEEFQIGANDKHDFGSYLGRVDVVLGSIKVAANLVAFKARGWTDADTTAFQTARDSFGPAEQYRFQSINGAREKTAQKNADAALLYEYVLTIQNAADLEYPATDPDSARERAEFLLGIFPPDHGGNHTPAPAPPPAPSNP